MRLRAIAVLLAAAGVLEPFHQQGEWSGVVTEMIEDYDGQPSRHRFWLRTPEGDLDLDLMEAVPSGLRTGAVLRVRGRRSGAKVAAEEVAVIAPPLEPDECSNFGEQRVAAIIVNFPGKPKVPIDPQVLRQMLFGTSGPSLASYWKEASYGQAWVTGDVLGPIDLDRDYDCIGQSGNPILVSAILAAAGKQADLSRYTRFLFYYAADCGINGGSVLGCGPKYSWSVILVRGAFSPGFYLQVTSHEGGHQLGLQDAIGRSYPRVPLGPPYDPGTRTVYFDPFTVMGNYYDVIGGYYNAQDRRQIGWLTDNDIRTVTQPGDYLIGPLGDPGSSPKALKIARPDTDGWFWVEYRQPSRLYESVIPPQAYTGALIHYEDTTSSGLSRPFSDLLDFTPGSKPDPRSDFTDPALAAGQTWTDPWTSLSLTVTSANAQGLSVYVGQDSCASLESTSQQFDWTAHTGTVQVRAPAACQWTATPSQPRLTVKSPVARTGNGTVEYAIAANGMRSLRRTALFIGRRVFTITQDSGPLNLPTPMSVLPKSGTGFTQAFTVQYSSVNGWGDIARTEAQFLDDAGHHCTVEFSANPDSFRIWSDVDTNGKSAAVGSAGTIQTPTCSLNVANSSVTKSGANLTVKADLSFAAAFAGSKTILGYGYSNADRSLAGPVWQLGSWVVGEATATQPAISTSGIVNGASFAPGPIAPGEIVTIFGSRLGPTLPVLAAFDANGFLSTAAGETRVLFDGVAAPMISASSGQVSVVTPYALSSNTSVRVEYQGRSSAPVTVAVAAAAPGIFSYPAKPQSVAINQDGSFNSDSQPAPRATIVTLFATGEGQTSPAGIDGKLPTPPNFPQPAGSVQVTFGGVPGEIQFAGQITPGVVQVNVLVPLDAPAGSAVPVALSIGRAQSQAGVTIALK